MPEFLTLDDIDVRGKRVLLRADLNVPVKDGVVSDATRIERLAPTVEALLAKGAAVVMMSHFGRPKGRDPKLSLRPVLTPLRRALGGRTIAFAEDCIGPAAESVVGGLRPGEVALLENLRFHPGEEQNEPAFARALAALGEVYVDDAFSAAHRAHASIAALAHGAAALCWRELEIGIPISAVTSRAASSVRASRAAARRSRASARSAAGRVAQLPSSNARLAERTARSTSTPTADGTAPTTSSVAGLTMVITSGDAEPTSRPPA